MFLAVSGWVRQFRMWTLRQGAYTVDHDEFKGGPLNRKVIAAVIDRVTRVGRRATREPPDQ